MVDLLLKRKLLPSGHIATVEKIHHFLLKGVAATLIPRAVDYIPWMKWRVAVTHKKQFYLRGVPPGGISPPQSFQI